MTKAEELIIVAKIEDLIAEAGADSYIRMTFAGICDICRRNIENDFGDSPVADLELERERGLKRDAERGQRLLEVERERDVLRNQIEQKDAEIAKLNHMLESMQKTADEWEENAHDSRDLNCELDEECRAKSQEITRLRAEIMRMKFERMTEFDLATMYEKMEGAN